MRLLSLILPLLCAACTILPVSAEDYLAKNPSNLPPFNPPPPIPDDEVELFHRANAGKYFAFQVSRFSSPDNMAAGDDPTKGIVVQFLLFRFDGDGTLQSVQYIGSPFNSGKPDVNFNTSPAFYSKKTKTYGETPAPLDPDNPDDPNNQFGIFKVRFINNFTRVQVAEDELGQGLWTGGGLIDVPLVIGEKAEVFAQYGMP